MFGVSEALMAEGFGVLTAIGLCRHRQLHRTEGAQPPGLTEAAVAARRPAAPAGIRVSTEGFGLRPEAAMICDGDMLRYD